MEAARWRATQMADLRMQVLNSLALRVQKVKILTQKLLLQLKAELKVREEMEASLQKLHEAHGAMLGMVLEALKLLGNGRCVLALLAVLVQKYKY
jgi:hypothetical protein